MDIPSTNDDKINNLNMSIVTPGKSLFSTSTMHERFAQPTPQKNSAPVSVLPTCDWATLDKFVASQLNGTSPDMHTDTFDDQSSNGGDGALWSLI